MARNCSAWRFGWRAALAVLYAPVVGFLLPLAVFDASRRATVLTMPCGSGSPELSLNFGLACLLLLPIVTATGVGLAWAVACRREGRPCSTVAWAWRCYWLSGPVLLAALLAVTCIRRHQF